MGRILIGNIKGPQGAQGIQGPQGPVGATGPQGPMPDLINNALTTEAGVAALDAAMGKTLQDQLTELNSNKVNTTLITPDMYKSTYVSGGYLRIGNWVYINMCINKTDIDWYTAFIPTPKELTALIAYAYDSKKNYPCYACKLAPSGAIMIQISDTETNIYVSGWYLAE